MIPSLLHEVYLCAGCCQRLTRERDDINFAVSLCVEKCMQHWDEALSVQPCVWLMHNLFFDRLQGPVCVPHMVQL
jgi:hypothetical protein